MWSRSGARISGHIAGLANFQQDSLEIAQRPMGKAWRQCHLGKRLCIFLREEDMFFIYVFSLPVPCSWMILSKPVRQPVKAQRTTARSVTIAAETRIVTALPTSGRAQGGWR